MTNNSAASHVEIDHTIETGQSPPANPTIEKAKPCSTTAKLSLSEAEAIMKADLAQFDAMSPSAQDAIIIHLEQKYKSIAE